LLKTNRDSCGNASAKLSHGKQIDGTHSHGNHRQLPPLNAVRAFEAAARMGGFHAAGAELNVSANAVGRLVKVLEDWLGVALFKRLSRGVAVTEAGRSYLASVGTLLDQLAEATTDLQRRNANILTISAAPSFVVRWLIPRLSRLTDRHPGLDVRLITSLSRTDFAREQVDLAIRHAARVDDELRSDLLMREEFYPVCSPALLARGGRLRQFSDLSRHVLLHVERVAPILDRLEWARWLNAVGAEGVDAQRGVHFAHSHLALQAAVAGQGVALASSAFIADDVTTGRLVKPFGDLSVQGAYGFFIVCPPATADDEKVTAFRNWALEEARSSLASGQGGDRVKTRRNGRSSRQPVGPSSTSDRQRIA
jgi:LysR family glycine cleavage system transcriptional activator